MEATPDRRRYGRFLIQLPVEYCTDCPLTGQKQRGQGVLKDISLGGVYFRSTPPVHLAVGQILTVTIAAPVSGLEQVEVSYISARGEVVRLDNGNRRNSMPPGVAVYFLEPPTFSRHQRPT